MLPIFCCPNEDDCDAEPEKGFAKLPARDASGQPVRIGESVMWLFCNPMITVVDVFNAATSKARLLSNTSGYCDALFDLGLMVMLLHNGPRTSEFFLFFSETRINVPAICGASATNLHSFLHHSIEHTSTPLMFRFGACLASHMRVTKLRTCLVALGGVIRNLLDLCIQTVRVASHRQNITASLMKWPHGHFNNCLLSSWKFWRMRSRELGFAILSGEKFLPSGSVVYCVSGFLLRSSFLTAWGASFSRSFLRFDGVDLYARRFWRLLSSPFQNEVVCWLQTSPVDWTAYLNFFCQRRGCRPWLILLKSKNMEGTVDTTILTNCDEMLWLCVTTSRESFSWAVAERAHLWWLSEDKNRYYTWSGLCTEGKCACMYSVHDRVIVDTMSEFEHNPLSPKLHLFDARFASQTRKYHWTQNSATANWFWSVQLYVSKPGQLHLDHSRVSKRPQWFENRHRMVPKKCLLSLSHPRASLGSEISAPIPHFASVSSQIFQLLVALLNALALLIAVTIRSSWEVSQTRPPFLGFIQFVYPSRCSRSLSTVCFFFCSKNHEGLYATVNSSSSAQIEAVTCSYQICVRTHPVCTSVKMCAYRVCRSAQVGTCKVCRSRARSIIGSSISYCSGVWDPWPVGHHSCDLNSIVVQKQRLALFCVLLQHSRASHPSWYWHLRLELVPILINYRVSLCSLCCTAPNWSVAKFSSSPTFNAVLLWIDVPDFEVLFLICVTESRTVSFLKTNTNSPGSLIGWTTGQMFRCFSKMWEDCFSPRGNTPHCAWVQWF